MGLVKRGKVWWMSFTYQGRRVRRSTETANRQLAEAIMGKVRVQLIEGKYFDCLQEHERTVQEMLERYIQERVVGRNPHSLRRAHATLSHLLPVLGAKTLAEVSPKDIAAFKAMRQQEGAKPATIVKELGLLKAAFNVAIREWEWCRDNPVRRVTFERITNARVRYLDEINFARLVRACPEWLQPIVIVARYTGMRRENVVTLQWPQVDLERRLIILEHTKNGDRLGVPLCDPVIKVLEGLRRMRPNPLGPVFIRMKGDIISGDAAGITFRRVCRRIGIRDFRFHDLRHTFASSLVQRGIDLYRVQRLLGHRDGRMTQRYAHLAPKNLQEAIQVFNAEWHKIDTNQTMNTQGVSLTA